MIIINGKEVELWPDDDGRLWYYHPTTGEVVYVE